MFYEGSMNTLDGHDVHRHNWGNDSLPCVKEVWAWQGFCFMFIFHFWAVDSLLCDPVLIFTWFGKFMKFAIN